MEKPIVVNLFGAPGTGKSTGAAYIFARLKMLGINAELITEFAKDKVWEDNKEVFNNQAYIFGKQSFRMSRCAEKVDVIVTDSPLPLSIYYNNDKRLTENFNKTVLDVFNSYNNMNFLLNRVKPYNPVGRNQNEVEANAIHSQIKELLEQRNIEYMTFRADKDGYDAIITGVYSAYCEMMNGNERLDLDKR